MPKISDDRRSQRRRQIAQAALRCFIRQGFEATSMADIVTESGLSAGAIYVHYESKQDLVEQVIRDVLAERNQAFSELTRRDPVPDPGSVISEVAEGVRADPSKAAIQVHLWSACLRDPALGAVFEEFSTELRRLFQGYLEAWLTQQGFAAEEAALRAGPLAQVVIGIRQGFVVQQALVPGFDAQAYLTALGWLDFAALPQPGDEDGPGPSRRAGAAQPQTGRAAAAQNGEGQGLA